VPPPARRVGADPVAAAAKMTSVAPIREGKIHTVPTCTPTSRAASATGMDIQALLGHALNELFRAHKVPVVES